LDALTPRRPDPLRRRTAYVGARAAPVLTRRRMARPATQSSRPPRRVRDIRRARSGPQFLRRDRLGFVLPASDLVGVARRTRSVGLGPRSGDRGPRLRPERLLADPFLYSDHAG